MVFEKVISIEEEEKRCLSVSFISIPLNDFKAQNLDTYSNRHLLAKGPGFKNQMTKLDRHLCTCKQILSMLFRPNH